MRNSFYFVVKGLLLKDGSSLTTFLSSCLESSLHSFDAAVWLALAHRTAKCSRSSSWVDHFKKTPLADHERGSGGTRLPVQTLVLVLAVVQIDQSPIVHEDVDVLSDQNMVIIISTSYSTSSRLDDTVALVRRCLYVSGCVDEDVT